MRLVTFTTASPLGPVRRLGALTPAGDAIIDLQIAYLASLKDQGVPSDEASRMSSASLPSTMETFIEAGRQSLEAAAHAVSFAEDFSGELRGPGGTLGRVPAEQATLLPPLTRANSLRDFVAFEDHARAGAARRGEDLSSAWFERPIYYKGNHRALIGHEAELPRPSFTKELDLELEVACVVGSRGRNLDEASAERSIFGYTVMNDWSARDVQRAEMASRLGPSKSKDFATSLGPCILTADEAGPRPSFRMTARVNGQTLCEATLADAHWSFPKMIAFVSSDEDIWPTDLYGSGTPFGGCLLDHDGPYLEPGDEVELEVEGIGVLRNRVTG